MTRGVEIAARCGDVGRLTDAVRALYDAIADPRVGVDAENGRLAKHGGARYLHVAGARVVEHLQRLRDGAVDAGVLVDVGGGESPSPVVAAVAADDAAATERRAYMRDPDEDARRTPEPWHAAHGDADVAFLTRFVVTAADACAAAGYHHRASSLYLDAVDAAETDAFAIEILPRAAKSARAAEYTEAPAEGDAAEARLRRALAARPPHVVALADARRLATTHETFAEAREAFAEAIALAKSAGDRDAAAQAQLELGDARAAVGDLTGAMMEWSACLDQIVGVYDAAYTRGSSALPPTRRRFLKRTGFGKVFAARRRRRGWRRTAAPRPNAAVSVSVAASRRRASRPISTPSCSSPPSRAGADPSNGSPAAIFSRARSRARRGSVRRNRGSRPRMGPRSRSRRRDDASRARVRPPSPRIRTRVGCDSWRASSRGIARDEDLRDVALVASARVELADVATDLGQLAVAADAIASLVYGEGFPPVAGAVVGRGVRVDDERRSRRDRNRFRRGWGSRSTPSSDIARTAPRERASRPRRRVTR